MGIREVLNRNLQEVFGEGDAPRRRGAIEELFTDDCVVDAPPGVFVGRDALNKFAGDLRATHPHFRLCASRRAAGAPQRRPSVVGLRPARGPSLTTPAET
jgi:hypothetical protein